MFHERLRTKCQSFELTVCLRHWDSPYLSASEWKDKVLWLRPEFFYFLVLGKFLGKPSVGGGNKNKNKIQKFPESE